MSIYRSYFLKNDTLIENNLSNNSQNPVTEISYGTFDKQVSRFIFDIDLSNLKKRISEGIINPKKIVRHILHMTNTISYAPQYIGRKSYSANIDRASSFELELFNIKEDWDEGSGYEFEYIAKPDLYVDLVNPTIVEQAVNWFERKTGIDWSVPGAYFSGNCEIIGTQRFEVGNEDLVIDVTDYVNQSFNFSKIFF